MKQRIDHLMTDFVHALPSVLTGHMPCVGAHCRRIRFGAGTGIKPYFAMYPLTPDEHDVQEAIGGGEYECFLRYYRCGPWNRNYRTPTCASTHDARMAVKGFFETMTIWTQERFIEAGGIIPEQYLIRDAA
jgi:hypothetical protein